MRVAKYLPRFQQAYRTLERLSERERWTRRQIEAFQLERINAVWQHARQHVAYYRLLADRRSLPERFTDLSQYRATMPVLDKATVRDAPSEFLSNVPERGFWTRTGGSTGTPMKCYWGRDAHREMLCTKYRFYDAWGVDFFDRTVFIWGHSASFAPGLAGRVARCRQPLEDRLRNRLRLSAYRLDPESLRRYLRQIRDFRPAIAYGYSSALHMLAAEAEATGFRCDTLRLCTLTGEPAVGSCVSDIQRALGAPAAIEYGSIECGAIASEWPDRTLRVREDVVLVETPPRADGRFDILVTVLNNPSFPLFRYAIGDVTDAALAAPEQGFAILGQVSGRNNDYIQTPSGGHIHSSRFDAFFKYETETIRRFRLHQFRDGSIQASVELRRDMPPPDLGRLATKLRGLVEGVRVTVEAVEELPHTSAGKHRLVTSDIPPKSSAWSRACESNAATASLAEVRVADASTGTHYFRGRQTDRTPVVRVPKAARLRQLLQSPELTFIMEAHNGLSARVAEEAGFPALWASGLSISAALGLRDANEASWTQVLEILEFMSDATTVPILVDGDTGHGNFNNARRFIRKLEQRNLAGVCIEDKLFPKMNSFLHGESQPLADIHEFAGRIRASKDAQWCDEFVIVARCEALIAGWGLDEAMRRAEAYHRAGADAILIHSSRSNASEVVAFKERWEDRSPVIIVPTKYYNTPTQVFRQHGFSAVIWANHLMRSCITAMQQTARQIHEDASLARVEPRIATLAEVFRLQNVEELEAAERRYLPGHVSGECSSRLEEVSIP